MFILDDILVRPFVSILDVIHAMAVRELYDVDTLRDELKENRLLYELGERSPEEYEARKQELEQDLQYAEEMREKLLKGNVEVVSQ